MRYPLRPSLACVVKIKMASVWCVVDEHCMARLNSLRITDFFSRRLNDEIGSVRKDVWTFLSK